jgi:hypothetical protein
MVSECVKDGNHMDLSSRAENNWVNPQFSLEQYFSQWYSDILC